MTFVPRPHQTTAVDAAEAAFQAGINRVLWNVCVAGGKSYMYAMAGLREVARGGRVLTVSPTRELVEQNAGASEVVGLKCGINAAALDRRDWRGSNISAAIQSIYRNAHSFGPISLVCADEAHLWPHSEAGMFRTLYRDLGSPRLIGGSGTPFRLQGGSLVEGEGAPFDKIVAEYSIIDGIRDGYLVPAFSAQADDKVDVTKLRTRQGEYTGDSQDAQMIAAMDNHIAQMVHHGADRRAWLVFEASKKAAVAMAKRMNEWGIPTGLILGDKSRAEAIHRKNTVEAFRAGRLRALVNVECLTTGFDVPTVDMLVCRRRTKSLSLWIQIVGRLLRTIGGNIEASICAGKADGLLLDFAGCCDEFGPLDFIRPTASKSKLVSCESCGARNASAAAKCWSCSDPMTKLCPACLIDVHKGEMDCPSCGYDMRAGPRSEAAAPKLLDTPSGAALIASYRTGSEREGGWLPILRVWETDAGVTVRAGEGQYDLTGSLAAHVKAARWIRADLSAVLLPNGSSRTSARQILADGSELIVPLPSQKVAA